MQDLTLLFLGFCGQSNRYIQLYISLHLDHTADRRDQNGQKLATTLSVKLDQNGHKKAP